MELRMDKAETVTRWALVALGVLVLLRLKFVLFAAALPVLAYWHYSNSEKSEELQEEAPEEEKEDASETEEVNFKSKDADIYGDEFWGGKEKQPGFSWDAGRDELDDLLADDLGLPKARDEDLMKDDFGVGKKDFSFDLGLGDSDFGLGTSLDFGDRHESKGKGKGKSKDKGKDGKSGEADPKQVFVANLGEDPNEDELRTFFEQAGEVDRLKVLKNPDGTAKGIGFVTFRTEEQAQKALALHNRNFDGQTLVVRLAHGKKGGEKGEKGEKGEGRDRDRDEEDRRRPERNDKGKGKNRGKGQKGSADVDDALEQMLSSHDGPLRMADFDFAARRFLGELKTRDRGDNGTRFAEAMDMVLKYCSQKDRSTVRKWTAYVFTLLQRFDPALSEEMRERDQERRSKGTGRPRMARQTSDDD